MLTHQKHLFSLPENAHFLNAAYMSPISKNIEQAGIEALSKKSNPMLLPSSAFFEDCDEVKFLFGKLINAPADRIALVPSVSYGMATVAKNLATKKGLQVGQHILVVGDEFPSDVYAWGEVMAQKSLRIRTITAPDQTQDRAKVWNERILRAINSETAMVVICHVHWGDGTIFDLMAIKKACQLVNALLVIDGTQSIGALPINIAEIQPDALVCAGYKWLMGPYTCGFAYFGPFFDEGVPLEQNWINRQNSEDMANLTQYKDQYKPLAARYNMGEQSNFIANAMLKVSINQLLDWTPAAIQLYCSTIAKDAIPTIQNAGYWIEKEHARSSHLFGILPPVHISIEKITEALKENNIAVSVRAGMIRVSPHVYNTEADFEALAKVLVNVANAS